MNAELYNESAEMAVIGALIRDNAALSRIPELTADDFANVFCQTAFKAIKTILGEKRKADLITVDEEYEAICGQRPNPQFLIGCVESSPSSANIRGYAQIMLEASERRNLRKIALAAVQSCEDKTADISAVAEELRVKLAQMGRTRGETSTFADTLLAAYEDAEARAKGTITPIRTGIPVLDSKLGGFLPGEMTVIGARPGVGKTAFALQIALNAAMEAKKRVLFCSAEMLDTQLGARFLARLAHVPATQMRSGKTRDDDWLRMSEAIQAYSELPVTFLYDQRTVEDICATARRKHELGECDILIVDYLQLLRTRQQFREDRLRVGYISQLLKGLTTTLRIPVVALAQVRRQNLGGRSRCPALDDLRDSGAIEQDADNVLFLHRPDDEGDLTVRESERSALRVCLQSGAKQFIVLSIAKQRQGVTGLASTIFDPSLMLYLPIGGKA